MDVGRVGRKGIFVFDYREPYELNTLKDMSITCLTDGE
jgi:hypothetical protein